MRTTSELIAELEDEAKNHWVVMMIVGFKTSTIFVRSGDENRLALLNSSMRAGGIPVGLIAADKTGNELTILTRVYPEHQEAARDRAEGFLGTLTDRVRESLLSHGVGHD
jgi:hypothetical protein